MQRLICFQDTIFVLHTSKRVCKLGKWCSQICHARGCPCTSTAAEVAKDYFFLAMCMAKAASTLQFHPCPAGTVNFWFQCYFCFFSGWHHRWCGKLCSCCRDPERARSLQDFCDGYSRAPVGRCPSSHRGILHRWGASAFWAVEEGLPLVAGLI